MLERQNERYCRTHRMWEMEAVCGWCKDRIFDNHARAHLLYACLYSPDALAVGELPTFDLPTFDL